MRVMNCDIATESYSSDDGWTLKREEGETPQGNQFNGKWVLRDATGAYVDHDKYRNDLECRHKLRLGRD